LIRVVIEMADKKFKLISDRLKGIVEKRASQPDSEPSVSVRAEGVNEPNYREDNESDINSHKVLDGMDPESRQKLIDSLGGVSLNQVIRRKLGLEGKLPTFADESDDVRLMKGERAALDKIKGAKATVEPADGEDEEKKAKKKALLRLIGPNRADLADLEVQR
jgi:hypothetical protein